MGIDNMETIRLANKLFVNAKPVFEDDEEREFCMRFNYVGAVIVKPVYVNSKIRMIRRIGDRIYVSFPCGTDKQAVINAMNTFEVSSRVRRYIKASIRLSSYPTCDMTGSVEDGFIIIEGKRYNLRVVQALSYLMVFEDETYYFTYRTSVDRAIGKFSFWHRNLSRDAFAAALKRVCEDNHLPVAKYKFNVTNGTSFVLKGINQSHLCVPEGAVALRPKELESIALFYLLTCDYKYNLKQIQEAYPYLYEVAFYVAKRMGLRVVKESVLTAKNQIYSDNYLARHGEKVYCVIDKIVAGEKICSDKILNLFNSVTAP